MTATPGEEPDGPFDDHLNEFKDDDGPIDGLPDQDFWWEQQRPDAGDSGPPEGTVTDEDDPLYGMTFNYELTHYNYENILVGVYRIRLTITGDSFGTRRIDRYMASKRYRQLRGAGYDIHELFDAGETHDDMLYFLRRLQAAEYNYSGIPAVS